MYVARSISSFRLTLNQVRAGEVLRMKFKVYPHFFGREVIKTRWPAWNRDPLMHAGNLVMKIARGSIKYRQSNKPSPPGKPPYSHHKRTKGIGGTPPFKQIFSLPQRLHTSVIVGMVGYRPTNPVPGLHEQGGTARRMVLIEQGQQQKRKRRGRAGKKAGRRVPKIVRYPERPFMYPALLKARRKLPSLWKDSLHRSRGLPVPAALNR